MNIKKKEIIIFGTGRLQKDFEYMFENLNITAYITKQENIEETYNSKKCYTFVILNLHLYFSLKSLFYQKYYGK